MPGMVHSPAPSMPRILAQPLRFSALRLLISNMKRTSSRRWNHDLGPRRNPDLAPALQPVCKPNSAGEGDERAEHDEAKGADEMAENGAESMAEEIAGGNEARCPYSRRQKIQGQE